MPLIRCPGCERKLKIPDDGAPRKSVRCSKCGETIRLDQAADDEPEEELDETDEETNGERTRRPAKGKPAKSRKDREPDDADDDEPEPIIGFWPMVVCGPALGVLLILSFFSKTAAAIAMGFSFVLFIVAIAMTYRLFKKRGHQKEMDRLQMQGDSGVLDMLFRQIGYAFKRPRVYGCWVALEVSGIIVMVVSIIIGLKVHKWEDSKSSPQAQVNPQPNPNPNPRPAPPPRRFTGTAEIDKPLNELGQPDKAVVLAAVLDLAKLDPARYPMGARRLVYRQLGNMEKDAEPPTRAEVVKVMVAWGEPRDVVRLLLQIIDLDSKYEAARDEAFKAIGKFKDPSTVKRLVTAFADPAGADRMRARSALRELGELAENDVLPLVKDKDANVRADAIALLGDIGTKLSVPTLEMLAAGDDSTAKMHAEAALKKIAERKK